MSKLQNVGLLILRVGIGLSFIFHGWPKITGGPEVWTKLGGAMGMLGITFVPVFWGFLAALSEFAGAVLLLAGLFTRFAAFFMLCVMLVACNRHIQMGDPFNVYSHALENMIVFLSIIFLGGGTYALDQKITFK